MKHFYLLAVSVLMMVFLMGCQKEGSTLTQTSKSSSDKVVVYLPSPAGMNEKIIAGFEAATGIKVELFEGTTGEILARLETEAANPVADVVVLASWADGLSLKAADKLLAYTPVNSDKMYETFVDADGMLYGTSASAVGVIYNTTLISELDADWGDFEKDEYKDLLVIPDPQKSGSCKDFLSGYINVYGEEGFSVWEEMADNNMMVAGANKEALEAVTTGEKTILIAGVDYNAYSAKAKGEPIDIYYPAGGTVVNPRPAMILKTSPNQEHAKLFMDYLLSDEAQEIVAASYLLPGREDILCDNRLNVTEITGLSVDWDWMMDNSERIAMKLNELCR